MSYFKTFTQADMTSRKDSLFQVINLKQEIISGSDFKRRYNQYTTSSVDISDAVGTATLTSSLYHTIYDNYISRIDANEVFDLTFGLWHSSQTVTGSPGYTHNSDLDKRNFASQSLMMNEKIDIYKQHAAYLLGDSKAAFWTTRDKYPSNNNVVSTTYPEAYSQINEALFIDLKRLFVKDGIRKETFAMRFYESASISGGDGQAIRHGASSTTDTDRHTGIFVNGLTNRTGSNVAVRNLILSESKFRPGLTSMYIPSSEEGVQIFTDFGAQTKNTPGGKVAQLYKASDIEKEVGLIFYDVGIVVLDLKKCCWADQHISGTIEAISPTLFDGRYSNIVTMGESSAILGGNPLASFIPDFLVSASIDNVIDHITTTRFSSGSFTGMHFQNSENFQTRIFHCTANRAEFNYSSNPSFISPRGQINSIVNKDPYSFETSMVFITTVGLYSAGMELLAVGKLDTPVQKSHESDIEIRVRLDF